MLSYQDLRPRWGDGVICYRRRDAGKLEIGQKKYTGGNAGQSLEAKLKLTSSGDVLALPLEWWREKMWYVIIFPTL